MAGWPAASASQALSGNRRSSSVVLGQPHLVGLSADFFCDQLEPQRPGHSVPKSCRPRRMVAGLQLSDDWLLDGTSLLDVAAASGSKRCRRRSANRLQLVPRLRQLLYVPSRRLGGPLLVTPGPGTSLKMSPNSRCQRRARRCSSVPAMVDQAVATFVRLDMEFNKAESERCPPTPPASQLKRTDRVRMFMSCLDSTFGELRGAGRTSMARQASPRNPHSHADWGSMCAGSRACSWSRMAYCMW
jgi:hypothetical protein